jgi:hypothetical protein
MPTKPTKTKSVKPKTVTTKRKEPAPKPGADSVKKLEQLKEKATKVSPLISPKYDLFPTPSGVDVIIRKLPIGDRDKIVAKSTPEGSDEMDMGLYCQHAIEMSLESPKLSVEEIVQMDVDDFAVIWDKVDNLSFRKVGEVAERFL